MSTLAEFLTRCLDADEANAKAVLKYERMLLEVTPTWEVVYAWAMMLNNTGVGGTHHFQPGAPSPEWVLADVAAKRAVLALHTRKTWQQQGVTYTASNCPGCGAASDPCRTLLALAQPYRGDDGWREEWQA